MTRYIAKRFLLMIPTLLGVTVLVFVLLPLAGYDFGQREHLTFALFLPYLLAAAGRAGGRPPGRGLAWLVGALGGVGIALKPHFVPAWLAVEACLLWSRRGERIWVRPESMAVALVGVVYAVAFVPLAPRYLELVGRFHAAILPKSQWAGLGYGREHSALSREACRWFRRLSSLFVRFRIVPVG